ncbi:MAG: phage tail protein [Cyanobacteria bacterium J06639_16]
MTQGLTQERFRARLRLQLTPMQVPAAVPSSALDQGLGTAISTSLFGDTQRSVGQAVSSQPQTGVLLHPGEPSELVMQVQNLSPYLMSLQFQVDGDFPLQWCRIGTEGLDLLPQHQMDGVLYFAIDSDFFEQHTVDLPLRLNYTGQLTVTATLPATGEQINEQRPFSLWIRPDSLYLNFLPDIYRDVDFIGRLLNIFEQAFEPSVNTLENLWAYLDPLTAPADLLPFLAHWVGWSFQTPIDEHRQRFLIRHALQIYRWRGTRRGLRFYLHLATGLPLDEHLDRETDKHISIIDSHSQGFVVGRAHLGQDTHLGGSRPFHFTVTLRPEPHHMIDETLIHTLLRQEKPAFCSYDLHIERSPPGPSVGVSR